MKMEGKNIILSTTVSFLGGFIATKIMEKVAMKLYMMEPEDVRKKEDAVRPGPPFEIAARKTAALFNKELNDEQLKKTGMAFHYGLGLGWAPLYAIIKHTTHSVPWLNGLITGASLSLIVDEGLTPALGYSAPNRQYPWQTHLRAFAAHLVYGLTVAGVYEVLYNKLTLKSSHGS
jgi:uncharacterized membrane protein YagU involved in acid resistance